MLLSLLTQNVFAFNFRAPVHSISESPAADEPHLVKWTDGAVSYVDASDEATLETIKSSLEEQHSHLFSFEDDHDYEPSVLSSEEEALTILRKQRKPGTFQFNVQCYNMAHVRAYEEYKRTGLKSMKAFLFFTDSYIRKYRFNWWFHVTPMTFVKKDGKIEPKVLDREWSRTPLSPKAWTDIFVKSKSACPQIKKYSQYENNQEAHDCYLQPVSMYYWQPLHLIKLENERAIKAEFNMDEVNTAYRRDF